MQFFYINYCFNFIYRTILLILPKFLGDICCLAVCNYCQFLAADGNFIFVDITWFPTY